MNPRQLVLGMLAAGILAAASVPAVGQEQIPTIKIVLSPAAEPQPNLKYQLLPPVVDLKPGNGAVFYNRIPAERSPLFRAVSDEKFYNLQSASLAQFRQEETRKLVQQVQSVVADLDRAARCEVCDWYLLTRIREAEGFFFVTLPEFQQTRSYARMLVPWVRMQIADGKYDEAARGLQTGYAFARDVGKAPTLVTGLIGISIVGMVDQQVFEWIQQPDAPNLYWALATLPRPLINLRPGLEGEMYALQISYPELRDLEAKEYPADYWQQLLEKYSERLQRLSDQRPSPEQRQWATIVWVLHAYPRAKQFLMERGKSAAQVEAMPVPKVVLVAALRQYEEFRDAIFKWAFLPGTRASEGLDQAHDAFGHAISAGEEIVPLASLLLPAVRSFKYAETRIERDRALFQTLEALRLHLAAHNRLPASLKEITAVPVPLDPVRGEPFVYYSRGGKAILEAVEWPGLMGHIEGVRYEIEFRRKGK